MIEINGEELKKIQIQIVKEVDKICKQNGLRYFLAFGSLLGAVRHKGFIPWDDDIDIWMPINDYKKLKKIVENMNGKYIIVDPLNEKNYCLGYPKIIDSSTYVEEDGAPIFESNGVFCDIFPLVGAGNSQKQGMRVLKSIKKNNWRIRGLNKLSFKENGIKGMIIKFLGKKFFYRRILKKSIKYDYETSKYLNGLYNADVGMFLYDKADFDESKYIEFEGEKFKVPKGYDNILKTNYGDYMQFPPEEQRINIHKIKAYYR